MQPATIHFVVTPESAICHGGHAYAMSTMVQTLMGISYIFVGSNVLTNTEHTRATRHLLERMLVYCHDYLVMSNRTFYNLDYLPAYLSDIKEGDGFLNLLSLCVLGEYGEILNPSSYGQPLDIQEQIFSMYARGCARNLVAWMHSNMVIDLSDLMMEDLLAGDIFRDIMEHHTRTMVQYKRWAEHNGFSSDDQACTAAAFESRLEECFSGNAPFHYSETPMSEIEQSPCDWTFAWPPCADYQIVPADRNSTVTLKISQRKCSLTLNDQFSILMIVNLVTTKCIVEHGAFRKDADLLTALFKDGEHGIDGYIESYWRSR